MREEKLTLLLFILFVLFSTSHGKEYKGAEYRTHDTFLYGRFEVNMKPANRVGVISSFFTYHEISSTANWNEIDFENIGRYDDMVQFNTITGGQVNHDRNEPISFNQYDDFHTYAFEWTPDYIAWFIDDEEVYRQTGEHVQTVNRAQKIMMNIWNPEYENWVGEWNDYSLPTFSKYDWVSYSSHTPDSGNTGSNNNFTLQWRDDFDTYDSTRWGKATHTFQGNKCDFITENVVFEDGKLVLCLTNSTNLGYTDVAKPVLVNAKAYSNGDIKLKFSEELDVTTAEVTSNYIISGVTILSATLSNDLTKVLLKTSSFDPTSTANIIIMNVNDLFGNTISVAAKTIISAAYPEFPLSINVGGPEALGYLPNQEWNENLLYGYLDSNNDVWPANTEIANTDEDLIYTTDGVGTKKYLIKVPNNNYNVTLMFAEKKFNESGKRIFDIKIEDEIIRKDFDIISVAGNNVAYNITSNITVEDELLEIYLSPQIDKTIISGIKVTTNPNSIGTTGNLLDKYELLQNYPNPFNPSTQIEYTLQQRTNVKLRVYDVLGNLVATLVDQLQETGNYTESFSSTSIGRELVSGIYFYQLQTDKFIETKKMLLLR